MKAVGKLGVPKRPIKELVKTQELLDYVADQVELAEGAEGIREIFRTIAKFQPIGTWKIAQLTKFPLPIISEVRDELEKAGLLKRTEKGAVLTEDGSKFGRKILKLKPEFEVTTCACKGRTIKLSPFFQKILDKQKQIAKLRPIPDTLLDQAYATPETAVFRTAIMAERGDLEGKNILFLGDDDLTSIPTALTGLPERIVALDIDKRLLELIEKIAKAENLEIEAVEHDLRNSLPNSLKNQFDVFFTDPPYTIPGLSLFLSRGIEGLKPGIKYIYLAFSHKGPEDRLEVQKTLTEMGLVITELLPGFNIYEGAEMIGGTTFLARLKTTKNSRPLITEKYEKPIYTGQIYPVLRIYPCSCGCEIEIGADKSIKTIEELKKKGCPACGRKKGFKLARRIRG
ncbi:MAG: bis-aminopropyl spermidine synthase family protein [Euryarchaeota archaeon]|nr:bis-aminopropyl spermidine synthase family protein [Euryarchaeota archaeon]